MLALNVRQPWANMIASGKKTIETRSWQAIVDHKPYRGPLLIVASSKPAIQPCGCLVAITTLIDCRPMKPEDTKAACCDYYSDLYAWVLRETYAIQNERVKGMLYLWDYRVNPILEMTYRAGCYSCLKGSKRFGIYSCQNAINETPIDPRTSKCSEWIGSGDSYEIRKVDLL